MANNLTTIVSSATKTVEICRDKPTVIIGERINPTGRKQVLAAFAAGDFEIARTDAIAQVEAGATMLSPRLTGEAILTVGSAFHEILHPACGIIAIGPFGCMPNRVAEAILNEKFTSAEKRASATNNGGVPALPILKQDRRLPFLAIETDGNAFPQIIEARLEAFCLQAKRLHEEMLQARAKD